MAYERPYYEDINYRPYLYYVVFGVKDEELQVSRERHHVDAFPEGLDFLFYNRSEHGDYLNELLGGTLGEVLDRDDHDLYTAVRQTERWAVIRGEVQEDADLHYMRNAIGFVQALVENGAVGVLDLQTLHLMTAETWATEFFQPEFTPFDHATILVSEMDSGALWLHTRGMRKFGRPDISIENVPKNDMEMAAKVVNQMIYYGVLGAFFARPFKLHTPDGACIVQPEFVDDMECPDFNNAYYRILWDACAWEKE